MESDGVVVAYTSVYGNTERAVEVFTRFLKELGIELKFLALGMWSLSHWTTKKVPIILYFYTFKFATLFICNL